MKYKVMVELNFDNQVDAQPLVDLANKLSKIAVNVNEGKSNQEIGFVIFEEHSHEIGNVKPCVTISQYVVGKGQVI